MRAVVQRCLGASVEVAGDQVGGFSGPGLLVLVGVTHTDDAAIARRMASKLFGLRIFDAADLAAHRPGLGPTAAEISASDADLPLLVISQFTLYGSTRKGRRPTWDAAAPGQHAEPLVDAVVAELRSLGADVSTGVFGADMQVRSTNDGPITVLVDVD